MKILHEIGLQITTTGLPKETAENLLHYLDTNNIPTKPIIVEYNEPNTTNPVGRPKTLTNWTDQTTNDIADIQNQINELKQEMKNKNVN